jgi:hypothetical protein
VNAQLRRHLRVCPDSASSIVRHEPSRGLLGSSAARLLPSRFTVPAPPARAHPRLGWAQEETPPDRQATVPKTLVAEWCSSSRRMTCALLAKPDRAASWPGEVGDGAPRTRRGGVFLSSVPPAQRERPGSLPRPGAFDCLQVTATRWLAFLGRRVVVACAHCSTSRVGHRTWDGVARSRFRPRSRGEDEDAGRYRREGRG